MSLYEKLNFAYHWEVVDACTQPTVMSRVCCIVNEFSDRQRNLDFRVEVTENRDLRLILDFLNKITFSSANGGSIYSLESVLEGEMVSTLKEILLRVCFLKSLSKNLEYAYKYNVHLMDYVKCAVLTTDFLFQEVDSVCSTVFKFLKNLKNKRISDSEEDLSGDSLAELNEYLRYLFPHVSRAIISAFSCYAVLKEQGTSLFYLFDQCEPWLETNMSVSVKDEFARCMRSYFKSFKIPDWDTHAIFTADMRCTVASLMMSLESVISALINYKRTCRIGIQKIKSVKRLYRNAFSDYLVRFDALDELKVETINDITVNSIRIPNIEFYESSPLNIPVVLQKCDWYLVSNRNKIKATDIRGDFKVETYSREPKSANEAFGLIKSYMLEKLDEVISYRFRIQFVSLADSDVHDIYKLASDIIQIFRAMEIKSQLMLVFVFDHITDLSSPLSVLDNSMLIAHYVSLLFNTSRPSDRLITLFTILLKLYRNAQLIILPTLIQTVVAIEYLTCCSSFSYAPEEEQIPRQDNLVKAFLDDHYKKGTPIIEFLSKNLQASQQLLKSQLKEVDFHLSSKVVLMILDSIVSSHESNTLNRFVFDNELLVRAYYKISKTHRIILSFMIEHFIRTSRAVNAPDRLRCYEIAASIFSKDLLKFKKQKSDPTNLDKIMVKALEKFIVLFENKHIHSECSRTADFLSAKYPATDQATRIAQLELQDSVDTLSVTFQAPLKFLRNEISLPERNIKVAMGNSLNHEEILNRPLVMWQPHGAKLYSLKLKSAHANKIYWFVINIPGNSLAKGQTVTEYVAPTAEQIGTGHQLMIFSLYEQTRIIKAGDRVSAEDAVKTATNCFNLETAKTQMDPVHAVFDLSVFIESTVKTNDVSVLGIKYSVSCADECKTITVWPAMTLTPAHILSAPVYEIPFTGPYDLYTLILVNIDCHKKNDRLTCYLHWLVTNIASDPDWDGECDTFLEYMPPTFSKETMDHRYAFFLYKQKMMFERVNVISDRDQFVLNNFALKNNLELVATSYIYCNQTCTQSPFSASDLADRLTPSNFYEDASQQPTRKYESKLLPGVTENTFHPSRLKCLINIIRSKSSEIK